MGELAAKIDAVQRLQLPDALDRADTVVVVEWARQRDAHGPHGGSADCRRSTEVAVEQDAAIRVRVDARMTAMRFLGLA